MGGKKKYIVMFGFHRWFVWWFCCYYTDIFNKFDFIADDENRSFFCTAWFFHRRRGQLKFICDKMQLYPLVRQAANRIRHL